eukprot:scaffold7832_cov106-Isochrysis_galbana.AAC.7
MLQDRVVEINGDDSESRCQMPAHARGRSNANIHAASVPSGMSAAPMHMPLAVCHMHMRSADAGSNSQLNKAKRAAHASIFKQSQHLHYVKLPRPRPSRMPKQPDLPGRREPSTKNAKQQIKMKRLDTRI